MDTTPGTAAGRPEAPARGPGAGHHRVRTTALGTGVIAAALAANLPEVYAAAPYLGLLAGALLVLAVAATARLWCLGRVVCQTAACLLAVAVATGQLLNAVLGLPGAVSLGRGVGTWGIAALGAEALVLGTVLAPALVPGNRPRR
ncbi:MAG: hypothetical protein ACXVWU_01315 [Nocardioides sp.]